MSKNNDLITIAHQHPDLHALGAGLPDRIQRTTNSLEFDLDEARAELLHPSQLARAAFASAWCTQRLIPATPSRKHSRSAYHWKHVMQAETTTASLGRKDGYVLSGVFLLGALHAGLPVSLTHYNGTIHARLARS